MSNIEKANKLKLELDLFRPLKKEDEIRIMQKFRLDWNYHSNHLEGNSLTYGETKALILFGITAQGKPLKDHFEISGHDEAIKWVLDIIKQDRPLTDNFIRELHKLILKEPYEVDAITPDGSPTKKKIKIGEYKTTPNHVKTKTGEIFRFATPEETPSLMMDLIAWYRSKVESSEFNPILVAAEFHYKFIRIHPFDDGNGRTARILMNFILLQFGYPPVIIKTEDKENYFGVLRQGDAGMLEPFVDYIAKNLVDSLIIMINGAKGNSIEDPDDIDKEIALLENKLKSVGQKLNVVRSQEALLDMYDTIVSPIAEKFIQKGELFERFYVSTLFNIWIDNSSSSNNKKNSIAVHRNRINDNTSSIRIDFQYKNFNQVGFETFGYRSQLQFALGFSKFTISDSNNRIIVEKSYGETMSEEEMTDIVNTEIRKHKMILESKVNEIQ